MLNNPFSPSIVFLKIIFVLFCSPLEDFLPLKIPSVHALVPNFKTYAVVDIIGIWVPTPKNGLNCGAKSICFLMNLRMGIWLPAKNFIFSFFAPTIAQITFKAYYFN
jgi:hypothetical protein